jgi:hypothetical protein
MQIYETLLLIAGVAGALATIYKTASFIVKKAKKCIKFFTDLNKKIEAVEQHCLENYITDLKLIIMSEEMPIGERLQAGEKYVALGQNGEIKAKYKLLQEEYEREAHEHEKEKA